MWRTLVEARVLNKMFFARLAHHATMIPVEVVEVGVVIVGFFTGVCSAACVFTPRRTLEGGGEKAG